MTQRTRARTLLDTTLEVRATSDLPAGVCGRVVGVALVYNVRDAYGTSFAPGCLDRTKREKLAAGKISLYADHDYRTHAHVGFVRDLETAGDREIMTADIFDTADGRALKEYLSAVTATGAHTGLSVGFFDRASDLRDDADGDRTLWYTEVELEEVSATPRPAVPGADVLAVRNDAPLQVALRTIITTLGPDAVRAELDAIAVPGNAVPPEDSSSAAPAETSDAEGEDSQRSHDPVAATMDERLRAVRTSYAGTIP